MSLTGPPAPLSPLLAAAALPTDDIPAIVTILGARGPDATASGVADVLHAATGPGNIISGRVTDIRPDGTISLDTTTGAEITLRHPPEIPVQIGSSVTLRLVATVPAPQAALLAIDGRAVGALVARAVAQRGADPAPAAAVPVAAPVLSPANTGSVANLGIGLIAPQILTALSEAQPGTTGQNQIPIQSGQEATPISSGATLVATLVRLAAPRPGATAPPLNTRYLVTVEIPATAPAETSAAPSQTGTSNVLPPAAAVSSDTGIEVTPPPSAPSSSSSLTNNAQASPAAPAGATSVLPQAVSAPVIDASSPGDDFVPQTALLAGRSSLAANGTTLVATTLGTLALPPSTDPLPSGSAVYLRVVATAPPLTKTIHLNEAGTATVSSSKSITPDVASALSTSNTAVVLPPTALAQALALLAAAKPEAGHDAESILMIKPGETLAAMLFTFLTGARGGNLRPWRDSPARAALDGLGRRELRERLDDAAESIGRHSSITSDSSVEGEAGENWNTTVLPFIGLSTEGPARLYQRPIREEVDKDGLKVAAAGERFVIEIKLRRLGPFQFDGLVRERRFDLLLRTATPLEEELRSLVADVFHEAIAIGGYAGEIIFGRLVRFPLVATSLGETHRALSV